MSINETLHYTCPFCGEKGTEHVTEAKSEYFIEHHKKYYAAKPCPEFILSVYWEPYSEEYIPASEYAKLQNKIAELTTQLENPSPLEEPIEMNEGGVGFKKRKGDMVLAQCFAGYGDWRCHNVKWIPLEGENKDTLNPWYCYVHRDAHQNDPILHADCRKS